MTDVLIRPYEAGDSLEEITELLHRAYADLGRRGLNFVATDQDVATTKDRIDSGTCFVAQLDSRLVGTVTVYQPEPDEHCELYRRPGVWHFGQFGVEPSLQGRGVGRSLLEAVERHALANGATEIALDTAEPAADLIALYERWGYRTVGHVQWHGRHYRSVLMSKAFEP
jgi:GNAT superfamily N-acetyltransferase